MGFAVMVMQSNPEDVCRQSTGAYLLFIGAWMCWQSIVLSREAWWRDPANTANFAKLFRKTGKWAAFLDNHPGTISEMIGDQVKAQGAVAMALCFPACILSLIGGLFLWQAWPQPNTGDREFAYFVSMCRATMQPIGFLMVLMTPVVTLDQTWKRGEEEERSEIELAWHAQHFFVHSVGFFVGVGTSMIIEAAFVISDMQWFLGSGSILGPEVFRPWNNVSRGIFFGLLCLRLCTVISQCLCFVAFFQIFTGSKKPKNTMVKNYKMWITEYATLVLSGLPMMYNAASTLVFAGHSELEWKDYLSVTIVSLFLLETLRSTLGFVGVLKRYESWAGLGLALRDFDRIDFEEKISSRFTGDKVPILLRSLKEATNSDLMSLDVQESGDPEVFPLMPHALGKHLPKVQFLVISPGICEAVKATRFEKLTDEDLRYYHRDLARALRQLPSAGEMIVPFGRLYKWRKMPIAGLLLEDYEADLTNLDEDIEPNTQSYWDWRATWGAEDTCKDITPALRAALPQLGMWSRDLISELEAGSTLRPLYELLERELKPLEEYIVHFRGLTGAPPQVVVFAQAPDSEFASPSRRSSQPEPCPIWDASRAVTIERFEEALRRAGSGDDADADASTPWLCKRV